MICLVSEERIVNRYGANQSDGFSRYHVEWLVYAHVCIDMVIYTVLI